MVRQREYVPSQFLDVGLKFGRVDRVCEVSDKEFVRDKSRCFADFGCDSQKDGFGISVESGADLKRRIMVSRRLGGRICFHPYFIAEMDKSATQYNVLWISMLTTVNGMAVAQLTDVNRRMLNVKPCQACLLSEGWVDATRG